MSVDEPVEGILVFIMLFISIISVTVSYHFCISVLKLPMYVVHFLP